MRGSSCSARRNREVARAREAALELTVVDDRLPEGVPLHLKLDTGMTAGGSPSSREPGPTVVGLMTHFATADTDTAFAESSSTVPRATDPYAERYTRHAANSAAALTMPEPDSTRRAAA